jgi:putative chitinase
MSLNLRDIAKYYGDLPHQNEALDYLQAQIPAPILAEFSTRWRSGSPTITLEQLGKIVTTSRDRLALILPHLNAGFNRYQVSTPQRIAHFIAQVAHESAGFRYFEELADGSDYEGQADLGNTQPGDGQRFKGRGLIQITGRDNYRQISQDLGVDYLKNPDRLAQVPDCVTSAFWYWDKRDLNPLADRDNFDGITLAINGGYNGYRDRLDYLSRARTVLC